MRFGKSLRFTAVFLAGLAVLAAAVMAQQEVHSQEFQPLTITKLRDNVYWSEGGAKYPVGNSGVIIGKTSVIVIDAKSTPDAGKALVTEIAKITPKPIKTLILTHSNGDHVAGIVSFPQGITIIAQENCKKELDAINAAGGRGVLPPDRMPTHLVKNREELTIDGVKLVLLHWAPAHTSGDLVIYLPDEKIVFTGDITAKTHVDPSLHAELNASAAGWIESAKGIAALDADLVVPGHYGLETIPEVQQQLKMFEERYAKVAEMVKEGKSWEETKAALKDTEPRQPDALAIAYQELSKKQ